MSSNNEFEHQNFNRDLTNIDNDINIMANQLYLVIENIKKLSLMGNTLKQHNILYKSAWKQQHLEKFNNIIKNAQNLDNIINENF